MLYLVFSQRPERTLDVPAVDAHAARFFSARVEPGDAPGTLRIPPGPARAVRGRGVMPADLVLAAEAEARAGGGGLERLARRCPIVWEITRHDGEGDRDDGRDVGTTGDATDRKDADALALAAILASVLLGPIVDPGPEGARAPEIFGVKTARAKLERARAAATR